jgi:hypothetical protein
LLCTDVGCDCKKSAYNVAVLKCNKAPGYVYRSMEEQIPGGGQ